MSEELGTTVSPELPERLPGDQAQAPSGGAGTRGGSTRSGWGRRRAALLTLAALGVIAVLALAPAAALTASLLPQPLVASTLQLPPGGLQAETRIRHVPVGLPQGERITSVQELWPFAVAAVGEDGAERLLALLRAPVGASDVAPIEPATFDYPFQYVAVEEVLRTASPARVEEDGAALGAALMLLTAQQDLPYGVPDGAARIAFAVLDHARSGGGCDAQLNLLALVASDAEIGGDLIATEAGKAQQACPGDPTPGWLATQRSLNWVFGDPNTTQLSSFDTTQLGAAEESATELVRRHPDDPGVLATLGDAYLASGNARTLAQPFTARRAFMDADTVFDRVLRHGESTAGLLGSARAQLGLGHPELAADLATEAADVSDTPGRALQLAVSAAEKAHRFAEASTLAKRLAELGEDAFPAPTAIIPIGVPLTLGSDLLTPLKVSLIDAGQGGGGVVADEGFVPTYRESSGLTDDAEQCPEWVWRRAAFLAGDTTAAAESWPKQFVSIDPTNTLVCPDGASLRRQIESSVAGRLPSDLSTTEARGEVEALLDDRQNLLRWAGDLTAARREAHLWALHLGDKTALAHQRLGEIHYLRKDYDSAAAEFGEAASRWRILSPSHDLAVGQAQLGQAAAMLKSSRANEAVPLLRRLVLSGAQGYGYQSSLSDGFSAAHTFATISYYAATLLGDHELATGQDRAAAEDFATALLWSKTLEGEVHFDAVRNSAAIAALNTGDMLRAISLSRAAVAGDPRSPVYLMTSAEVAYRAGDATNAIRQGRGALESDPSDYPAANNVGVLLARRDQLAEASRVLRAAVDANPEYALAWFNLGVVEGRRGPVHLWSSQGALARAVSLDPDFANRPHQAVMDTTTYRTELDVSKPLEQGWSFAGSQRAPPAVTVGLLAAVLGGIGLVSLRDTSPSPAAKDWLEGVGSRVGRLRGVSRLRRPWLAVVATVVAFILAFWRVPMWPWTGVAYAGGLCALVAAAMAARAVIARHRVGSVVQGTWGPGVLIGLVSGAFGAPIAPLPVVRAPVKDPRVALAAPLTLALLSLVLLLEAALLHTPLTASFCVAAFIMAASVLLPVRPLDGARAGRAGVVGAAGLLGAVLLLGLGLV